jgi:hypothetical protein
VEHGHDGHKTVKYKLLLILTILLCSKASAQAVGPSSDYTITSTPIIASPFAGDLLIGASTNNNSTGYYTPLAGWTVATSSTNIALEYQLSAGTASSYSSTISYSTTTAWAGTIAAFTCATGCGFVQSNINTFGTGTAAFSSNNGSGDLLVAAIRYNQSTDVGPITSITDTRGNTWYLAGLRAPNGYSKGAGGPQYLEFWYALNSTAGGNTITLHGLTAFTNTQITIGEFSGAQTIGPPVDYNFSGSSIAASYIPGATTNNQYTIAAINNVTGNIDYTGRDAAAVFRSATLAKAAVGGTIYFKNGIYPGQTALQENIASQTNWYVYGIAAPIGAQSLTVGWHFVCESITPTEYTGPSQSGCIYQILPSAWSGSEPSGLRLSGFWQRPSPSFGALGNNQVFFVNGDCRIPDSQRAPTTCVDMFATNYSSYIGMTADTAIPITDNLCGGMSVGVSNTVGFTTNQAGSDATYFENTWAIGWVSPYNSLSNHPVFINAHSVCNYSAGSFGVGSNLYGGQFIHFQDIHNIVGMQFNCTNIGTRFDVQNLIEEDAQSGSFARTTGATEGTPGNCMGKVDVMRASANAVAFNPGAFFASGNGAKFLVNSTVKMVQPGLVTSSSTSAATTGTTKQTLATYTFAYNNSGAGASDGPFINNTGAVYRISAWGTTAANGNTKTVEIDFGGTAIATISSVANNGSVRISADIIVGSSANTQECDGHADDGTIHNVLRTAPGITGSANIVVNLAATTPTASGDFTFKGWTIEYLGGN